MCDNCKKTVDFVAKAFDKLYEKYKDPANKTENEHPLVSEIYGLRFAICSYPHIE